MERILDAKLHIKNKNCDDILKIDQEREEPYSIYTLMAQWVFAGAKNKKVDRYIPIDEIKKVLARELGDKCNVEFLIEEYLQKEEQEQEMKVSKDMTESDYKACGEQDAAEVFSHMMDITKQSIIEKREKYDITTYEEFMYYEEGDTIWPVLLNSLKKSFVAYNNIVEENYYKNLMEQSARKRCEWLAYQNRSILIRDQDWNKIFTDIEDNKLSFSRYYPMVRFKLHDVDLIYMVTAIVLNDKLYDYLLKE